MSGYIKYFDNSGKNMSFMLEDDSVLEKYKEIWSNIKKTLNAKLHSMPVYDEKHIKAKVKQLIDVVNTKFWGDKVSKVDVHYTCIACISIDSVTNMEKKYPQVYLEEFKYKIKKKKMPEFTELLWLYAELESDSDSE